MTESSIELPSIPPAETPAPKTARKPARRTGGTDLKSTRRTARAAARAAVRVQDADEQTRATAAALLGCQDDVVELAAHIVAPGATNPTALISKISDLTGISDEMERVLSVSDMAQSEVTAVRDLLLSLGLVEGNRPSNATAQAVEIARAIPQLDQLDSFSAAADLIG